jgi:soluble lytic murein transglycosylase-like protein
MKKNGTYSYVQNKNSKKDSLKLISVLLFFVLTILLLFNLHQKELEIESIKNQVLEMQLLEKEKELKTSEIEAIYMEKENEYVENIKEKESIIEKQNIELEELKKYRTIFQKVKKISKNNMNEKEALATAKALYHAEKMTNIDWEIIASIIMVESNYRPRVISDDPSYGLMQLTYKVGQQIGEEVDGKKIKINDLLDIERNIKYGSYYLLKQVTDFSNLSDGIMAYNLGAQRVTDLKKINNGKIESKYLKKVKKYYEQIKK